MKLNHSVNIGFEYNENNERVSDSVQFDLYGATIVAQECEMLELFLHFINENKEMKNVSVVYVEHLNIIV